MGENGQTANLTEKKNGYTTQQFLKSQERNKTVTIGKALDGKPYAGNPHVRFDEGEVASCTAEASLRRVPCRRQPEAMTRPQVASRSEVARGLRASVCAATPRRGSILYSMRKLTGKAAILAAAICVAAALPSWADTAVWKSNAGGDITEPTNWEGDTVPQAGDTLDFSAITSAQTLTGRFEDDRVFASVTFGTGVMTLGDGNANACSLHLAELRVERPSQTEDYGGKFAVSKNGTLTIDGDLTAQNKWRQANSTMYIFDSNKGTIVVKGKVFYNQTTQYAKIFQYRNHDSETCPVFASEVSLYNSANNGSYQLNRYVIGEKGIKLDTNTNGAFTRFKVNEADAVFYPSTNYTVHSSERSQATSDVLVEDSGKLIIDTTDYVDKTTPRTVTWTGRLVASKIQDDATVTISGNGTNVIASSMYYGANKSTKIENAIAVTDTATLQINAGASYIISNIVVSSGATLHIPSTTVNSSATTVIESVELADGAILSLPSASASALTARTLPITLPSDGVAQLRIDGPALDKGTYTVLTTVPSGYGQHLSVVGTALGSRPARLADDGESLQLVVGEKGFVIIFE